MPGEDRAPDVPGGETRREFLTQAAVAGAGLIALPIAEAGASPTPATPAPRPVSAVKVALSVNGHRHELEIDPRVTLLDALRERIGLTGSKKGCDQGACGACTVLVAGRRVNACLTLAVAVDGDEIKTVEGLADGDTLHPLQAAFIKHDGFQCGYCTPGQLCSAAGLLAEGVAKTPAEIREWMSGNLCRCGAYPNIVAAIAEVAGGSTR